MGPHGEGRRLRVGLIGVALLAAGCASEVEDKLDALSLGDAARAALGRLRWAPLRSGDAVAAGDVVLCGPGDRVVLAFSRRLMTDYLGIDAEYLLPELFDTVTERELFFAIDGPELVRLQIPAGIGAEVPHPPGRVRDLEGTPRWTGDLRAVALLFSDDPVLATQGAIERPAEQPGDGRPRRIGISPFPRMGPRAGVVIERVLPGGPADQAGLATGDRILAVDGAAVRDIRELKRAIESSRGPTVVLRVRPKGSQDQRLVTIRFGPSE